MFKSDAKNCQNFIKNFFDPNSFNKYNVKSFLLFFCWPHFEINTNVSHSLYPEQLQGEKRCDNNERNGPTHLVNYSEMKRMSAFL